MTLDERRQHYKCGKKFAVLEDLMDWPTYGRLKDCTKKVAILEGAVAKGTSPFQSSFLILISNYMVRFMPRTGSG